VFDHTVKPVLLYGSEIWGFFPGKKLVFNADSFFYKLCKNVIIENVHKIFCKLFDTEVVHQYIQTMSFYHY
jgi:TctA family transporter